VFITGNGGWPLLSFIDSRFVVLDSCRIHDNTGYVLLSIEGDAAQVSLPRTEITGNAFESLLLYGRIPDLSEAYIWNNRFADESGRQEQEQRWDSEEGYGDYQEGDYEPEQ
jgi:hypothetical protein